MGFRRFTLVVWLIAACIAPAVFSQGLELTTVEIASGLVRPLGIVSANDGSGRLFLVQQTGEILIHDGSEVLDTAFLDLSDEVSCCGERGLLGLAFHPDYADNGLLYVNYTAGEPSDPDDPDEGDTVVAEYEVSADPDIVDAASARVLLTIAQPAANHNGGHLAFGPDGFLYIATGDGGGGGDPDETGQDLESLLGKLLRIDVDTTAPGLAYGLPPDNPFLGPTEERDEIWAYGLRNPWRFSFDRLTGDLWIGDVGQDLWEEIDFEPAAHPGGVNYGWDCREGAHPFADDNGDENVNCPMGGLTDPVMEYAHASNRCSVTGGFRYRGDALPRLRGVYLFGELCTGEIFGTVPRCDGIWQSRRVLDAPFSITSFGEDEAGEVYVTEYVSDGSATSKVRRLVLGAGSEGPDLSSTPPSFDFGDVEVGDTVETVLGFHNVNTGPEAAVVSHFSLTGDAEFSTAGSGGVTCGAAPCLAPGTSCTVRIAFKAAAIGNYDGIVGAHGNFDVVAVPLAAEAVACSSAVNVQLTDGSTENGTVTHRACDTVTAGPYTVGSTGNVTLRAGTRIVLQSGFAVASGGQLTLETF